jgi:uroporphyrinogen decarboxylase
MNSRQRLLNALERKKTDRLPVTTHHLMPSFLKEYIDGISDQEFFDYFGLDPIKWIVAHTYDSSRGEFFDPTQTETGFLEARRICTDNWRFFTEEIYGHSYPTKRLSIITPGKTLSMVLQSDVHTTWLSEHVIKEKSDIDILAKYMPSPKCDVEAINKSADEYGDRGLLRGHIPCFDGFGQPGCWQDAACMYGIENLIIATFIDPQWVHAFLRLLQERKRIFIESLAGTKYDILELGGGDASTTVISPDIFNEFVAPYDAPLIEAAHKAGQRISYHTCGGMMPILEDIASMKPDAMETFSPEAMGGDTRLDEAKKRIGEKVCMIGGFDQFHFFTGCSEDETRREVRRCFDAAGGNGGFILSPSDHFFEADLKLLEAFADEARQCSY